MPDGLSPIIYFFFEFDKNLINKIEEIPVVCKICKVSLKYSTNNENKSIFYHLFTRNHKMAQTKIMNENGFSNDEIFYQDFFRTKEKIEHEIEIIDISNDDDNDDTDIKYNATANLNDRIKELEKQLKFKDLKIKILEDKQNLDINDKLKLKIELDAIKEAFQKLKNENNQIKSEKIDVNIPIF